MVHTIIAIDGTVCSGKNTVARETARALGFIHVSSGEIYRVIAYYLLLRDIPLNEEREVEDALVIMPLRCGVVKNVSIEYSLLSNVVREELHTEECSLAASQVAQYPCVRHYVNRLLRKLADVYPLVIDGRDIGTKVFPQAALKVFLTASLEVRVTRRLAQLEEKGYQIGRDAVEKELLERDERDMKRAIDPLKQAEDALIVDTTHQTLLEEVETIVEAFHGKNIV